MKYARPVALRAACSTFRPCLSPSPLSTLLLEAQSITSLSQHRAIQKHVKATLRCFSSSSNSLARSRFVRQPSPAHTPKSGHDIAKQANEKASRRQSQKASADAAASAAAQNAGDTRVPAWQDYDPEIGIPLPSGELDQTTITSIFGPGINDERGNQILRIMHYRRLSGSLIDVGVDFPRESRVSQQDAFKALEYIRSQDPTFSETEAGIAWADAEVMKVEQEYMTRAENLGIYKRNEDDPAPEPQGTDAGRSVYGDSALDAMRKRNKQKWMEEDRKKKEAKDKAEAERIAALRAQGQEHPSTTTTSTKEDPNKIHSDFDELALAQPPQKAWLAPVERKPWVKYYEEQATIVKENKIPQLSTFRRLAPSALLLLAILAGCCALDEMYAPPPRSARMFPDIPPSVATLGAITAINLGVFIAWRVPPLWRTMNKYFLVTPGYPYAFGVFGAQFSHQGFSHLFVNTILLWPFGLMLHEDVGRGTFLAVYLSCGALGAYGSLAFNVYRNHMLNYIFGSSTAVLGTLATTCLVRADNDVTIFGYTIPSITGMTMLGVIGGLELLAAWKGYNPTTDYAGHISSMAAGVLAGWYLRHKSASGSMTRRDHVSLPLDEDITEST